MANRILWADICDQWGDDASVGLLVIFLIPCVLIMLPVWLIGYVVRRYVMAD